MSILGAAAIAGALGLVGAGMNKKSVDNTNDKNMEIARMNNQWNEQMMLKQMQYNTDMWHMQNAYNDPSAQLQRLKDAGLNPYMMMNGGNSGIASSAGGVTPPTAQAVTMQPFQGYGAIGDMISRGLEYDIQRQQAKEDLLTSRQNRQMQFMDMMNKTMNAVQDVKDKQARTRYQNILNTFAWDNQVADLRQKALDRQITAKEIEIKSAESVIINLQAKHMPQTIANQLALQGADLALKAVQKDLTIEQAQNMFFDTWKKQLQGDKQFLDNKLMRETWADLIMQAKINASPQLDQMPGFIIGQSYGLTGKFRPKTFDWLGPIWNY